MIATIPLLITGFGLAMADTAVGQGKMIAAACYVDRMGFDQLEAGMSPDAAAAKLGCIGELSASDDFGAAHEETFIWEGREGGYASATFKDGALVYKRQRSLR